MSLLISIRRIMRHDKAGYIQAYGFVEHGKALTGSQIPMDVLGIPNSHVATILADIVRSGRNVRLGKSLKGVLIRMTCNCILHNGMTLCEPDTYHAIHQFEASVVTGKIWKSRECDLYLSGYMKIYGLTLSCFIEVDGGSSDIINIAIQLETCVALDKGWRFNLRDESGRVLGAGEITHAG